jgi:hypothetical protein
VWAVDPRLGSINPYIQLISNAFSLIGTVFTNKESVYNSIVEMNQSFKALISHNSYVYDVLNSYQPYRANDTGNLVRILSNAGLLNAFAAGLSAVNIIESVVATSIRGGLDDLLPTIANCSKYYTDLFGDPAIYEASAMDGVNTLPPQYNENFNNDLIENQYGTMRVNSYARNLSMPNMISKDGFIPPPSQLV